MIGQDQVSELALHLPISGHLQRTQHHAANTSFLLLLLVLSANRVLPASHENQTFEECSEEL